MELGRGGSKSDLARGWRMTGSALQALGVELTCESSCKGRGVRGEGGGPVRPSGGLADDGKRSEAVDVVDGLFLGENVYNWGGGAKNPTGYEAFGFF